MSSEDSPKQDWRDQRHRPDPVRRRELHGAGNDLHAAVPDAHPRPGRVVARVQAGHDAGREGRLARTLQS